MIRQKPITIKFEGDIFEKGARADLIVENKVLPELKSLERLKNIQKKQVSTYLKLIGIKVEYLLNFGGSLMKDGIARTINGKL